ncbi:hypothetical protein N7489_003469 [Penicillium chrysogenum]|jgi:hypothetical protein|uniref:Uncharacterized protein n=1 Tax=Penicillium chrysogenum TaxID=5076 RepID=A0ABQ8W8M5_PENCH|nr:uncharacterized protein N7489_003469 [Penicillium chrysogenum]KAJ5253059.1 hypothetical protein N7489_003469 [Penicillium chrysogenum]KAJ5260288.1 hypothetical protein N7505_009669 [Penicillium chrysogenum]KAJ6141783.1 hypothetical protein N7497_010882 [Penicillium chrysogenum]
MPKAEFDSSNKTAGFSETTRFDIVDAVVRPHEVFELNHHHCEPEEIELVFIGVSSNTDPTTLDGLLRRHLVLEAKVFRLYRKHPASEEPRVLPRWLEVFNGIKPPIVG